MRARTTPPMSNVMHGCILNLVLLVILFPSSQPNSIKELVQWTTQHGGLTQNWRLGNSSLPGGGRTAFVVNALQKGDVLVRLPVQLTITHDTVQNHPLFQRYVATVSESKLESCTSLALFLLLEHLPLGEPVASDWAKYYATLPVKEHNFNLPQFHWDDSPEALRVLLSTPSMSSRISNAKQKFEQLISLFSPTIFALLLQEYSHISEHDIISMFLWAYSIVQTRAIVYGNKCTLVPMIDLLNHDKEGHLFVVFVYDDNDSVIHSVGVVASHNVSAGDEMSFSYTGERAQPKCAQNMLLDFGFLPKMAWCVELNVPVAPWTDLQSELKTTQRMLLEELGVQIGSTMTIQLREGDAELPMLLMAVSRLLFCENDEILKANKRSSAASLLSTKNERKALRYLHELVTNMLLAIPSLDKEDKLMWSTSKEGQMKIALQVRQHERSFLRKVLDLIGEQWTAVLYNDLRDEIGSF